MMSDDRLKMMSNQIKENRLRIRSIMILAAVLVISVCVIIMRGGKENGVNAVITVDGEVYATLPLKEDTQIVVKDAHDGYNRIVVEDGRVFVSEADCANQVCVNTAAISHSGQVIACIPHGLVVTIEAPEGEVDAVAY